MQYQYQINLYLDFIQIKSLLVRTTDNEHGKLCDMNDMDPPHQLQHQIYNTEKYIVVTK